MKANNHCGAAEESGGKFQLTVRDSNYIGYNDKDGRNNIKSHKYWMVHYEYSKLPKGEYLL